MKTSFDEIWIKLQAYLKPGTILRNWTVLNGYLGDKMEVVQINQNEIVVQAPNAKTLQRISRNEFEKIWNVWPDYLSGQKQRQEIREITHYSKYIISIFRWVEDSNL